MVRQGIRQVLEQQPDIHVVGEAGDGLSAVEQMALLYPDVVLLDLQLPGLSGVEAIPRLRAVQPSAKVVILTVFSQDEELLAALKAGARGYILKDAPSAVIVEAIREALHGRTSLSHELETRVIDHLVGLAQRAEDPDALTEREVEILRYLRQGKLYKEIAAQPTVRLQRYWAPRRPLVLAGRGLGFAAGLLVIGGLGTVLWLMGMQTWDMTLGWDSGLAALAATQPPVFTLLTALWRTPWCGGPLLLGRLVGMLAA